MQTITGDSQVASILAKHLAFIQGKPFQEESDENSEIIEEVEIPSTDIKTSQTPKPNMIGKLLCSAWRQLICLCFSTFSEN